MKGFSLLRSTNCRRANTDSNTISIGYASLRRRSMVVHDLPSLRKLAKYEREQSVRRLAVGHSQLPGTADEGRIRAQDLDAQAGEFQLSHLMPGARIGRAITFNRGLPSATFFRAGKERELRRIPVACHEGFQIVLVPRLLLRAEDVLHGSFGSAVTPWDLGLGLIAHCEQHDLQSAKEE